MVEKNNGASWRYGSNAKLGASNFAISESDIIVSAFIYSAAVEIRLANYEVNKERRDCHFFNYFCSDRNLLAVASDR